MWSDPRQRYQQLRRRNGRTLQQKALENCQKEVIEVLALPVQLRHQSVDFLSASQPKRSRSNNRNPRRESLLSLHKLRLQRLVLLSSGPLSRLCKPRVDQRWISNCLQAPRSDQMRVGTTARRRCQSRFALRESSRSLTAVWRLTSCS